MNCYLRKIDLNMGQLEYDMYQDIPKEETGSSNSINGMTFEEFKEQLKKYIENAEIPDEKLKTTTNRYIFYVDDYPVGEIGIRTTLDDFWKKNGSQIFYKIRLSERNKGYGTKMLELGLEECKKLGFKEIGINCNIKNYASQKVIKKNNGKLVFNYGDSNLYLINLENDT